MPPPADGFASRLFLGPALRTQPDRRLVSLVRDGYESAFEEIVRRYGKALSRYAAAIVGARGEDVTQDAFSKALLALRREGAEIELRPWLFRIVRNTALNDLRDNPPSPELLAEAIVGGSNPAEEIERREELADLMRRLRSLPEPQRAAIVMREMEGLSHAEIAAALGVSGGAARQAIHRARQTLRNGAGMLIPLPLLQALLAGGTTGTAEVAAGAGGVAGAGVALKAAAATVLVAGAVGTGVAIHESRHGTRAQQPAAAAKSAPPGSSAAEAAFTAPPATDDSSGPGDRRDRGKNEAGDDHGVHEDEAGGNHSDRGGQSGDDDRGGRVENVSDDHGGSGPGDAHGERSGSSGDGGGGPGPSGKGSGRGDEQQSAGQSETSPHGGGPGPSGGSSHSAGSGDGLVSGGDKGSSGGPGSSGSQEPPAVDESGGGPGPSDGSSSGGEAEAGSGDGSSGGGDDHGGD
jgi:RNA polymerase sigma factor (sigma-70 family)